MALSSHERAASILTGPDGSAYPYSRDAALSTALLVMLPFDLLSLGSLRRALESLNYKIRRLHYQQQAPPSKDRMHLK